jgi:phosphoglucomutase
MVRSIYDEVNKDNLKKLKEIKTPSERYQMYQEEYYNTMYGSTKNRKVNELISNMSQSERKDLLQSLIASELADRTANNAVLVEDED